MQVVKQPCSTYYHFEHQGLQEVLRPQEETEE